MNIERLPYLLAQYEEGNLSLTEWEELREYLDLEDLNQYITEDLEKTYPLPMPAKWDKAGMEKAWQKIAAVGNNPGTIRRVPQLPKWGWVAATVIIIGSAVGIFMAINRQSPKNQLISENVPSNIHPGTNRAILTVDNKEIKLAADKQGIEVKNAIAYSDGQHIADAGEILQLSTPRGGQYQAELPDGTKVWLNAESSIKFPSQFQEKARKVEISGEVYFEVAKNNKQPFSVQVNGVKIDVLGTSFNVCAYPNENTLKTTLIEGSVRILATSGSVDNKIILKPGQQAVVVSSEGQMEVADADIAQTLAWKDGYFSFEKVEIKEMAKQIERWYDVEIVFEGAVPHLLLRGGMDRGVQMIDVVGFLKSYGFTVRLEDRTLYLKK